MAKSQQPSEPDFISKVVVRLLLPEERPRFDLLLEQKHYLHSSHLSGQTLRYVAEVEGQWVALLGFGAPALHLKAREKLLGWSPRQRARRLTFVVSNSRFLLLTERERYPNLASRVLGICLRRLSDDWMERWKHPVLVVESFVDESRYRGTSYKACGFQPLGLTAGYGRSSADFYEEHGQPKQLFIKELSKDAFRLLRSPKLPSALEDYEICTTGPCPITAGELRTLRERFTDLEDKRSHGHGFRFSLATVLTCAAVATLLGGSGYRAFAEICSKLTQRQLKALRCPKNKHTKRYQAPAESTFYRIIHNVDAAHFERIVGQWLIEQEISVIKTLAVDGKTLRGSGRSDGKPLQLLSAVTHNLRLTIAQIPIEEKSNEIPAIVPLLRPLRIEGVLVTADALHCQQKTARFVTQEAGGDYVFGLKGNQDGIFEKAKDFLHGKSFSPSASLME